MNSIPKVVLNLTREEMFEIVESFKDLLDDPRVTSTSLYFDPDRFIRLMFTSRGNVHPFIGVGCDPAQGKED